MAQLSERSLPTYDRCTRFKSILGQFVDSRKGVNNKIEAGVAVLKDNFFDQMSYIFIYSLFRSQWQATKSYLIVCVFLSDWK